MPDPRRTEPPDAGSPVAGLIALLVSIVLVLGVVAFQAVSAEVKALEEGRAARSTLQPPSSISPLVLGGKVAIGFDAFLQGHPERDDFREQLMVGITGYAQTPSDLVQLAVLRGELLGGERAVEDLDRIEIPPESPIRESLTADIETLRRIYAGEDPGEAALAALREHHGWFGELAALHGSGPDNPARGALLAGSKRMAVGYVGALVWIGFLCIAGLGLFITAIVMVSTGRTRWRFLAPQPGGSVYLETFAIFVVSFVLLQLVQVVLPLGEALSLTLNWLLLLVPFWPLARGVTWRDHRMAIGWHCGRGFFREVGAGIAGYLAGLPILGVGLALTLILVLIHAAIFEGAGESPAPPSHPVIDLVQTAPPWMIVLLMALATAWAPIVEEAIFRGALYRHARGRVGMVVSALLSAVVFAAMHPQGLAFIPVLASLGVVFALMREWRGSLIPSMTAHALHNGMVLTLVLFIAST